MKADKLSSYLFISTISHILLLIIFCSGLLNLHFNLSPTEIEVAVCGVGDMEKEMGGTGNGKLEDVQPFEDSSRTLNESELNEEDHNVKYDATRANLSDKISEGDSEELTKKSYKNMLFQDNESKPEDTGTDLKTEDGDSNKDVAAVVPVGKIDDKFNRSNLNNTNRVLDPDENKLPENNTLKKVEKAEKDAKAEFKEEQQKKRKKKRHMIANLLAEARKKDKINSDFDKLLEGFSEKDLGIKKRKRNISSKINGQGGGSGGSDLTDSDYGIIKNQIIPNWSIPIGVQNLDNMLVKLEIRVSDDGTVNDIVILDESRYNSDTFYRLTVDSARRAVILSSPLKIPRNKIDRFRNFIIVFNPKDAIR